MRTSGHENMGIWEYKVWEDRTFGNSGYGEYKGMEMNGFRTWEYRITGHGNIGSGITGHEIIEPLKYRALRTWNHEDIRPQAQFFSKK